MDDGHNDTGNVKLETPSPQTRKRGRPRKPPMIGPHNAETPKGKRGRPPKIVAANGSTAKSEVQSSQRKRGRPPKQPRLESHEKRTQSLPRKRGRPPKSNTHMPQILHFLTNSRPLTVPAGDATLSNAAAAAAEESSPIDDMEMRERIETPITVKRRGRPPKQTFLGLGTLNIGGEDPGNKRKEILIAKDRLLLDGNKGLSGRHGLRRYNSQLGSPGSTSMPLMQVDENIRSAPFMDSVVKVFCVHTEPNFSLPWQRKRQFSSTSSGFIISGRRLLTNAHSVEHHTQVKVKKRGSDTKFLATVLAFGTECDIALLTVNDDEFWEGVTPVEFGALPNLQDAVTVVGYPIGGDTISVTSGVVSRIEVTSYVHGATELLGVQIDAAINAGNSGGPAFNDKVQCVGIAFQSLKHEDAENIGYVIPTPVITHFIQDYARTGDYTGFPTLGIEWQNMENPDLRKALGMASNQKGVRVRRVEPTAPSAAVLQSSDILLSFDGIDIANDGTVPFRNGERIGFSYLVSQKYTGEKATIQILRKGKSLKFDIELETQKRLVPVHIKGKPPPYYIVAGVVFAAVSVPYLRSEYGKDYDCDSPVKLLDKLLHSMAQTEDEQLVLVSQVLVADINIGYEEIVNTQVIAFNGVPVRNLKHLANMVETCKEEFLRFNLEYEQILVLETEKAKTATPEILATHCIPSAMSDDLKS